MSTPEQNPSGQPDPYGAPQDPAAGQAPSAPQYGATPPGTPQPGVPQTPGPPQAPQYGAPAPGAPQYGAPPAQGPQYGAQPGRAPQTTSDPGKPLGIVGLVLSILGCTSLVGLILSIVALVQSKKAGHNNGIAIAGIIVGAVLLLASIIGGIIFLSVGNEIFNDYLDACQNVPAGDTTIWEGREVVCP